MTDTPDDATTPQQGDQRPAEQTQPADQTRPAENVTETSPTEHTQTEANGASSSGNQQTQPTEPLPPTQHTAPQQESHAFYARTPQPGQPYGPYAGHAPRASEHATTTTDAKKGRTGLIVACLAIGALVGGAAGGGVYGLISATQQGEQVTIASNGARTITVNDPDNATTVTAVAANASPSVVTIAASGRSAAGTGSGIIISEDGYVLTNTHVVTLDGQTADPQLQVRDSSGNLYSATIVGTDPLVDLAVIKLDNAKDLKPAKFADSSKLNVGDMAIAIGAPLGLSGTVTDGIVSALNRSISISSSAAPKGDDTQQQPQQRDPFDLWNFDLPGQSPKKQQQGGFISLPVIQTDAAINPGNSGGALLDSEGKVIGVNVAIASASHSGSGESAGSIGVGFAVPSNLAKRVADEIIDNGSATHGLLGATVQDAAVDSSLTTVGARIHSVTPGGAAAKAGLKEGDVVTNFNGVPITDATDLTAQVRFLPAGADAEVTYQRDGKNFTAEVTLGALETN